jgi:hypothetical protein
LIPRPALVLKATSTAKSCGSSFFIHQGNIAGCCDFLQQALLHLFKQNKMLYWQKISPIG